MKKSMLITRIALIRKIESLRTGMKQPLAVCAPAFASISVMAQATTSMVGDLSAERQKTLANFSTEQKEEVAEKVLTILNRIDPNETFQGADHPAICTILEKVLTGFLRGCNYFLAAVSEIGFLSKFRRVPRQIQ